MTSLTSILRGCYELSLLRPMLSLVRGFAISSDGYFVCPHHEIAEGHIEFTFCVCVFQNCVWPITLSPIVGFEKCSS